jgi:hypothetical protein
MCGYGELRVAVGVGCLAAVSLRARTLESSGLA